MSTPSEGSSTARTDSSSAQDIESEFVHDYVIVFPNPNRLNSVNWERLSASNLGLLKAEIKKVIDAMRRCGMQVKVRESVDKDELFAQIRIPERSLLQIARLSSDRVNLSGEYGSGPVDMKKYFNMKAGAGVLDDPKLPDDFSELELLPDPGTTPEETDFYVFRSSQRIRLIEHLLRMDTAKGGAGLNLWDLSKITKERPRVVLHHFAVHSKPTCDFFMEHWVKLKWKLQPIDELARYFGEHIAIYFAFLGCYVTALWIPAVLGVIMFLFQLSQLQADVEALPAFCLCVALWATLFIEFWKREQMFCVWRWGTLHTENSDRQRLEFRYDTEVKVGGDLEGREKLWKRFLRVMVSLHVVAGTALCVSVFAVGVLLTRSLIVMSMGVPVLAAGIVLGIFTGCRILVVNMLICWVGRKMTDLMNCRTETSYMTMLVVNTFPAQCINHYISFFWVSFAKSMLKGIEEFRECDPRIEGGDPDCMNELAVHYGAVVLTLMFLSKSSAILTPLVRYHWRVAQDKKNVKTREIILTYDEHQCKKDAYEDTYDDYAELILEFGFLTMFGVTFPLGFMIALLAAIAEMHVDGFRLLRLHRRPFPHPVESIGIWLDVLNVFGFVAVAVNSLLLAYNSTLFNYYSADSRVVILVVAEHVLLVMKFIIATVIDDVPTKILNSLKVQSWFSEMVVYGAPEKSAQGHSSSESDDNELQFDTGLERKGMDSDDELLLLAARLGLHEKEQSWWRKVKWQVLIGFLGVCTVLPIILIPMTQE